MHHAHVFRHILDAAAESSSDSRDICRNSTTGATGEGSNCDSNGRASSDGAYDGVSGSRKLKRMGRKAGGGAEYARHGDGDGGKMSYSSDWHSKRGQEWKDFGMEMKIGDFLEYDKGSHKAYCGEGRGVRVVCARGKGFMGVRRWSEAGAQ